MARVCAQKASANTHTRVASSRHTRPVPAPVRNRRRHRRGRRRRGRHRPHVNNVHVTSFGLLAYVCMYIHMSVVRNVHASLIANGRRQRQRRYRLVACQANTHHPREPAPRGKNRGSETAKPEGWKAIALFSKALVKAVHTRWCVLMTRR